MLPTSVPTLYATLLYRVQQSVAAIIAHVCANEQTLVAHTLTRAEHQLFAAMPRYDQRHCLDVYHTLCAAGHSDPLLLRAALFHDCGKLDDAGRPMPLPWYMFATGLKLAAPWLYRAAAASGRGPLRPVRIYAEHAWRGAQMAAQAGSPPEIVAIIRHYHDERPMGRAALLQWADNQH